MKRQNRIVLWTAAGASLAVLLALSGVLLLQCGRSLRSAFDLEDLTEQEVRSLFARISGKALPAATGPVVYAVDPGIDVSLVVAFETDHAGIQYVKQHFAGDPTHIRSLSAEEVLELLRHHHGTCHLLSYWQQKTGQPLLEATPTRMLTYVQWRRWIIVIDENSCGIYALTWR